MKYQLTVILIAFTPWIMAQSPVGIWQTIDDDEGDIRTEMEIYQSESGTLEAKVHHLFRPDAPITCDNCPGEKKDAKLIGMVIIWNLEDTGKRCEGGRIMDPASGRDYKCYVQVLNDDKLKVRGYIAFPAIGRTQYWYRKGTLSAK